jgi:hypothetical protein
MHCPYVFVLFWIVRSEAVLISLQSSFVSHPSTLRFQVGKPSMIPNVLHGPQESSCCATGRIVGFVTWGVFALRAQQDSSIGVGKGDTRQFRCTDMIFFETLTCAHAVRFFPFRTASTLEETGAVSALWTQSLIFSQNLSVSEISDAIEQGFDNRFGPFLQGSGERMSEELFKSKVHERIQTRCKDLQVLHLISHHFRSVS